MVACAGMLKVFWRRVMLPILATSFMLSCSGLALARECEILPRGSYHAEIEIQGRVIAVIGWNHPNSRSFESIRRLESAANTAPCPGVQAIFQNEFQRQTENLNEGQRVLRIFGDVHHRRLLAVLGLELDPVEFREYEEAFRSTRDFLNGLERRCPNETRPIRSNLLLLTHGPEHAFSQMLSSPLRLVPLENVELKNLNQQQIEAAIAAGAFAQLHERAPMDARAAYDEIKQRIFRGENPEARLFDRVVAGERDPERRRQVRREVVAAMEALRVVVMGARARDVAMVQRAISTPGNMAIAVGAAHFDHMLGELSRRCRELSANRLGNRR